MIRIKFVATSKMPFWKGAGGKWKAGHEQDMPDHIANRLLNLHKSPFVKVEAAKSVAPPENKMVAEAEENKAVDTHTEELKDTNWRGKLNKKKGRNK